MWCHKPVEVSRTKMVASRVKVVSVVNATVCSSADTQKVQNTMEVMNASVHLSGDALQALAIVKKVSK